MNDSIAIKISQFPAGSAALEVVKTLENAGHEAWLVGGGVRDLLLSREPKDFDVATSATPNVLSRVFPRSNMVGAKFGVFIVRRGDYQVEVATFREEGEYLDRRRPDLVKFSTLEADARRRDFTVNALYYSPSRGVLRDLVGGQADIDAGILRTVGNPKDRFEEDSLRVLRGIRFAAKLGFNVEPGTWKALCEAVPLTAELSIERVRDELVGGLTSGRARVFLQLLDEARLMDIFLPELGRMKGCEQPPEFHPEGDVFSHTLLLLENLREGVSPELAIAVLLHDVGKPATQTFEDRIRFNGHDKVGAVMAEEIARRLRFSNDQVERITTMVRRHMQFINLPDMRKATLKRFLAEPTIDEELELHRLDCLASHKDLGTYTLAVRLLEEFRAQVERGRELPEPLVSGRDLITLGLNPGPRFSVILRECYDAQLDGSLLSREDALLWVQRFAPEQG